MRPRQGIACDDAHVYVTDQMRCRIVKLSITTGKTVLTQGRSGREDGNFDAPHGLALIDVPAAPAGAGAGADASASACRTLFVSDNNNHRIVALDASDLSFRYKFGHWGHGDGEMISPLDIAVHGGHLLVADGGNQRLCLFTLRGEFVHALGPDGPDDKDG